MPPLPSSSAQVARRALAERLKEIMKDAGLNGRAMAAACGWHPAKVSRIRNAITPPSEDDIRAWCAACHADDQVGDLLAAHSAAASAYVTWKRLHRGGMRQVQVDGLALYLRTKHLRFYSSNVVPALLQTPAYATALIRTISQFRRLPDDVEAAVAVRMERSRVLREGDHRIVILLEEAVLRTVIGSAEVMAEQLGALLGVLGKPYVALGVIPFGAVREMWPAESFYMFDGELVKEETLSASISVTAPSDLDVYERAFRRLAGLAAYGPDARRLIARAIEVL
jgi:transcriptional regulator with XRE-family HTH domain